MFIALAFLGLVFPAASEFHKIESLCWDSTPE